jgi:hypothetical protein
MVQACKRLLFPNVVENVTTAQIFGIAELDRRAGGSITRQ